MPVLTRTSAASAVKRTRGIAGLVMKEIRQFCWRVLWAIAFLVFGSSVLFSSAAAQSYTISGHVTDGFSNNIVGATVQLSGSKTATTSTDSGGAYSFTNLQAGNYNLNATPPPNSALPGHTLTFVRTISNLNSDTTADLQILFTVLFNILVKDGNGAGVPTVGIRVNNDPFIFAQTNSFGVVNIGVTVPITGNGAPVTFTPDKNGYIFLPPSVTMSTQNGDQSLSFTAVISNAPPIQLMLDVSSPGTGQAAALESVQFTRDPFPLLRSGDMSGSDNNTRVTIFATDLQLAAGETASAVIVILTNGNITAEMFAEDVRPVQNTNLTQITFKLPNQTPSGTYSLQIHAHGQTSNAGTIRIQN